MKLAEALAERSALAKKLDSLRERARTGARHQEGEDPAEDAPGLITEALSVIASLENLARRINHTNAITPFRTGTLADALAQRSELKQRHALFSTIAEAGTGAKAGDLFGYRRTRSELKMVSAVDVPALRALADDTARQHRELDAKIQQANWATDLAE